MNIRNNQLNKTVGVLTLRLVLGFIFFMQGFGKVFKIGVENLYQSFFLEKFEDTFLPVFILKFAAYYTSYIELTAGFLLIIGLFRNYALYALASVLVIVSFGHGLLEPIWDLHHVVFRLLLLVSLLLLPQEWDRFSLDRKFSTSSGSGE